MFTVLINELLPIKHPSQELLIGLWSPNWTPETSLQTKLGIINISTLTSVHPSILIIRITVPILFKHLAVVLIKALLCLGGDYLVVHEVEVLVGTKDPLCGSQLHDLVKVAGNLAGDGVKIMSVITAVGDPGFPPGARATLVELA